MRAKCPLIRASIRDVDQFRVRAALGHLNGKRKSGLKIIVRGAGLPGRHAGRVARDRRQRVIR